MAIIFLDRDGVINRNRADYVKSWDEFEFLPGARRAIAALTRAGHRIFVFTNQACVGKGLTSAAAVDQIHRRMIQAIGLAGGRIETILWCPHRADEGCACRKPAPGLLLQARDVYGVSLSQAIVVGDSVSDLRAAEAVGVPAILVLSGQGWHTAIRGSREAVPRCGLALNLAHATRLILRSNVPPERWAAWLQGIVQGVRAIERRTALAPLPAH
jgi:histidinol-phosphate phosphatase family protein